MNFLTLGFTNFGAMGTLPTFEQQANLVQI